MTVDDKLRNALRETARHIPDVPPPLDLSPGRVNGGREHPGRRRWIAWAAPLAAAAAVIALIVGSLAVVRGGPAPRTTSAPSRPASVPPYYVALAGPGGADIYDGDTTVAQVRATATGAVLARVRPPRPYVSFSGVSAAADDRTFVLSVLGPKPYPRRQGLYLLRIDPGGRVPVSLRALPASFLPAGANLAAMALSPDGASLAAEVSPAGTASGGHLYVFNLATGTRRAWTDQTVDGPYTPAGLGYGGVNPGALSWTADGRHLAFVSGGWIRLLDLTVPGSGLTANSRRIATAPLGDGLTEVSWRAAVVTPDGRTAVIVEELASDQAPLQVRDRLLEVAAATGRVTVLNDRNILAGYQYEQIMYASPDGSTLVVSGARPGAAAGIVRGGHYTPLPWSKDIAIAAW